jgi:hypothetical protein
MAPTTILPITAINGLLKSEILKTINSQPDKFHSLNSPTA